MNYTVTAQCGGHYEVTDEHGRLVGSLTYKGWVGSRAEIQLSSGIVCPIEPKGFWHTSRVVNRDGMPFITIKSKMGFGLTLNFESGRSYDFVKKSLWRNDGFVLRNGDGQELGTTRANFNWRKFNFNYEVWVGDALRGEEGGLMPFVLLYCNKYMQQRMASAG